jgi:predicted hotdog family 3-hydroxylacyl-ACP dehydratase
MQLDRDWITAHIPHQGAMCLIDEVLEWTDEHIHCRTASHRRNSNPLRTAGLLRSECGIEYGAQAIAIHSVLNAMPLDAGPVAGMLVSARAVMLQVDRLDDIDGDLVVRASRLGGDITALLYDFSVSQGSRTLLSGRASILLKRPMAASGNGSPK